MILFLLAAGADISMRVYLAAEGVSPMICVLIDLLSCRVRLICI